MDVAHCQADGKDYTAAEFSRLPAEVLAEYRQELRCLGAGCGAPAYFRARSRSGQAPCFASRQHAGECDAANRGAGPHGSGTDVVSEEYENWGERIVIDIASRPRGVPVHHNPDELEEGRGITPRHSGTDSDGPRRARSTRRLSTLLRDLVRSDA